MIPTPRTVSNRLNSICLYDETALKTQSAMLGQNSFIKCNQKPPFKKKMELFGCI